jgi:hypothetical protein
MTGKRGEKGEKIWGEKWKRRNGRDLSRPPSNRAQIKSHIEDQNLPCHQSRQLSDHKDINDFLWEVELCNI